MKRMTQKLMRVLTGLAVAALIPASIFAQSRISPSLPRAQPRASFRSILAKVPKKVRKDFLESMVFMHGGLASAYIGGIKSHLSPTEYVQLFAVLLGRGRNSEDDPWPDHRCAGQGTCSPEANWGCTHNCYEGGETASPLGNLLARVPANERGRFLESLDFREGRLVNANVDSIKSRLNPAEFEQLFGRFGITSSDLRTKTAGGYYRP